VKILIVSGHFSPDIGYQEVRLASSYARQGHDVRVVTTTYVPARLMRAKPRRYAPGRERRDGYEILRLRILARVGTTMLPRGMRRAIREFEPDVAICIGISKFMPVIAAFHKAPFRYRLISIFGDSRQHRAPVSDSLKDRAVAAVRRIGFALVKRQWYRYAIARSDRVIVTTPEAEGIISEYLGDDRERLRFVPLGFDDQLFFFDRRERDEIRRDLRIGPADPLLVTATKIEPAKRIERLIEAFERVGGGESSLNWLLIGCVQSAYSDRIRKRVERSPARERIHLRPLLEPLELRAHYNAADLGVWTRETITIQEAMGTGLRVLLPRTTALSHLIDEGIGGVLWGTEAELEAKLEKAALELSSSPNGLSGRNELAKLNRRLSYERLAPQLLERL
jgi:glycosyltransferase involved in cell wall biosynthesis